MKELKPCPICNHSAQYGEDFQSVQCSFCGCEFGEYESPDVVAEYWNTRPIEDKFGTIIAAQAEVIEWGDWIAEIRQYLNDRRSWITSALDEVHQSLKYARLYEKDARAKLKEAQDE